MANARVEAKPKASFPVRRMDYDFEEMPQYWCDNEPSLTHYFTGLSTLFPEGESYFVRSVRALRTDIQDNRRLDRDIGAFIGQEAMHSKEHHAFHESAQRYGLDPESLERATGMVLKTIESLFPKKWNLLVTVGLEHYTAVLVETMMRSTYQLMRDDTIRNLWLWHSIEETEHKAVAFDMYQHLYGKGLGAYVPRVAIYTFSLAMITVMSTVYHVVLMKRDKQLLNGTTWRRFIKFAGQHYKEFIPQFLAYYRFDFHPNDVDVSEVVAQAKQITGLVADSTGTH
ncbi:metal-dependent hydrolase [Marinobacter halophilus]|uniref:Metal-dependent hydrolase n=1 Tax=Marinobacter halophilus TaxID=1323740 RepID=A0A2T1KAY1_9GAMM|nr:metal-dependent hydrolase [Marinobacter halophilus]PSF06913.1 metal-dependent hydrolase [Marinobacter halophilus]GGC76566.1 metal-dependent hydrolase [Marinobacter halophilus]